jgi:hypothetical protein
MDLDDIVSLGWLTVVGLSTLLLSAAVAYNIYVGRILVTGQIAATAVLNNLVIPVVFFVTVLAALDVYGKRRIKTLLDLARGQGITIEDVQQSDDDSDE